MSTTLQTCDPKDITFEDTVSNYYVSSNGSYLTNSNTVAAWHTSPSTTFSSNNTTVMTIPSYGSEVIIEPTASLNVKGDIIINGENLDERLQRIETLLHIPSRDVEMEKEFPKLKKLWEEYNAELEKYKTWKRLNK